MNLVKLKSKDGEKMANEQNLKPQAHILTLEEQSNGGKASGEARRLRAAVKKALQGKVPSEMSELRKYLKKSGVDTTNDNGIAFAMVLKALAGDKAAADWVRDTSGEKPKDEIDINGGVVFISGEDEIAE